MRSFIRWLCATALVLAASVAAASQALQEPAPGMTPAQVQQLFDAMLVMQAQEALGLSESQYAQFLTRLKVLQEARRRNQQQRMKLLNDLQRLINPRTPRSENADAEIRQRLATLQALEERSTAEIRQAYQGIDDILDVRQQARFRVFEEQIERRKLELIARARQGNPNRGNPARRPPPTR
jgi:hypothetical protein